MTPISRRTALLRLACLAVIAGGPARAADGVSAGTRRIALGGYDPVSYFEDGKPMKGSVKYSHNFDDVTYTFRSPGHRDKFAANPEKYAPQYAGYCAGGVSKGYKVEPDPEAWLIADGKLYVFQYKDRVPEFRKKIAEVAAKADTNWPALKPR